MASKPPEVGYWMIDSYSAKLEMEQFEAFLRKQKNLQINKLMIDSEESSKYKVVVHRIYDLMTSAVLGNEMAERAITEFEDFVTRNPSIVLTDSLEGSRILQQREFFNTKLAFIDFGPQIEVPYTFSFTGNTADTSIHQLKFPIICKPHAAHGADENGISSDSCHQMVIAFNADQLSKMSYPCIGQEYVNHNAILYKLYVIGRYVHVALRPSVRNFNNEQEDLVTFNTRDVSKKHSCSSLNFGPDTGIQKYSVQQMLPVFKEIAQRVMHEFRLTMFGADVIVSQDNGKYYIIDLNTSPDFTCIGDFHENLSELLQYGLRCWNLDRQNDMWSQTCVVSSFAKY